MELHLELVHIPVSDVDRAKAFYTEKLGFSVDHDASPREGVRMVQLTPPGSACSIAIGTGLSSMEPGYMQGLQLVVGDMDEAHAELTSRGLPLSEVEELGRPGRPGFKFAYFSDPDGNRWVLQEIRQA